jgi:two-component system, NarL family, response regulator DevR
VIRVALLDDHPAVLAGLQRLIERAPDLQSVACVDSAKALWRALDRASADVAVVDYDLARGDGLAICQRLKQRPHPPRVVIYSAYAGPALAVAAHLAGADALVHKSQPVSELLSTIRCVADGRETVLPEVPIDVRHAAMHRLEEEDRAVAAMLLAGTSQQSIAEALALERREVARRIRSIVARVRPNGRAGVRHSHSASD